MTALPPLSYLPCRLQGVLFGYALDRLVTVSSIHDCTSTSVLSTLSSSRGLTTYVGISHLEGGFTLRCLQRLSLPDWATRPLRGASRLDAFSVYPFQAWLPGRRLGSLTGTPAARPSRSSRTKDSRGASRLDAFSVYPFQAWLPGRRLGSLTGTPAARPSRSSRTKDSSSQISYAHAG